MDISSSDGLITQTPFFFLFTKGFFIRTNHLTDRQLHTATKMSFYQFLNPDISRGGASIYETYYQVKLLGLPQPLLISKEEMHVINSHFPDGISKEPVTGEYLSAEQLLFTVQYPLHFN